MEIIEILKAILFGILEGITEWLPVSSTGHLILLNEWVQFNICESEEKLAAFMEVFDVVIQLGAILAVVIIFFKDIWPFGWKKAKASAEDIAKEKTGWSFGRILVWKDIIFLWIKIFVACVPAMIYGFLLDSWMEEKMALYKPVIVAVMLILVGIVFIVAENHYKGKQAKIITSDALDYRLAFWIGVFQLVAAVLPGTSRSGATIIGGLLLGLSRSAAAEFTFYLAVPTMFGASLLKVMKFLFEGLSFTGAEMTILLISSVIAFAVSVIVIKFLMAYIKKHDFKVFGWYRIVLGAVVLIYFISQNI